MHIQMIRLYEAARTLKGIGTQADLARLLNKSSQVINNWEARGISKGGILEAQSIIGCRAEWIADGTGDMVFRDDPVASITPPQALRVGVVSDINIPQYNTGGMGGNGLILRDQPGIIQNWSVSQEWLRANVPYCSSPSNLCIVTGFGDSMPDMYSPGDPVLVDRGFKVCDHDGVFFFRVGDEGFIKRLQRIPGEGIRVISQNKEYETWTIKPDMDFDVFGKVLKAWKGRSY